jgi:ribulose-5-phosphate 4-epimerase/fuculose-1-phosphate aldolase
VNLRLDLAAAHRLAVLDDLHEGTWNHFSAALPGGSMLLTPEYVHWSQVTSSSLIELGEDHDAIPRDSLTWVGYRIHYGIHRARPDAVCVLHTHSPHATALSCLAEGRLEMIDQGAFGFAGRVSYNEVYDRSVATDLGAGEAMAEALDGKDVLFLRNHGVIVVGRSVAAAYTDLYLLERACRVQLLARATGEPLARVSHEEAMAAFADDPGVEQFKARHFEAMKRVLDATQPDYAD